MADIIIYQCDKIVPPLKQENGLCLRKWTPSWLNLRPPGKDYKYVILSLFHLLGLLPTKNYAQYQLLYRNTVISSCLLIPKFMKWPFMGKRDVQFAYVITDKNFRGKGYTWQLIYMIHQSITPIFNGTYWYVTDTNNVASQKLAQKVGFKPFGIGKHQPGTTLSILKIDTTFRKNDADED